MPGTGPLRRSSEPVRKQAIVGKSQVEAALDRCDRSAFIPHNHHFPVVWTLTNTFIHPQHHQYELQNNTWKSSLNLTPKRDIHAEPLHDTQFVAQPD
jgi:hypothetical protein